jgi:O-antigen ligase
VRKLPRSPDETRSPRLGGASAPARDRIKQAIFLGLGAVVAVAPLPLAADRPLAWDAVGISVAVLLLSTLLCRSESFRSFPRDLAAPLLLFLAVACFVVFQMAPWTPAEWHHPVWSLAADTLHRPLQGAITVDPHLALVYLFRLCTYVGVFYLAASLCADAGLARAGLLLVSGSAAVYAAYGLIVFWSGNATILWLPKWGYLEDLTGTFVNRNSFATYLGLGVLAALTDLIDAVTRYRPPDYWRDRVRAIADFASSRSWSLITLFLLVAALLLTHSRGGLLCTMAGVVVLLLTAWRVVNVGQRWPWGLAALPVLLVLVAFLVNGATTAERLLEIPNDVDGRLAVYELTWQAIGDRPWLGTGLGSFASVFPIYRTGDVEAFFDMTHNDYLQNLMELGIPAASCLFAGIVWLTALCVRGARVRRRNIMFPRLGIAVTTLVALHATLDFSLQMPAVTVTYMFLLGIAVAQSRPSRPARAVRGS